MTVLEALAILDPQLANVSKERPTLKKCRGAGFPRTAHSTTMGDFAVPL